MLCFQSSQAFAETRFGLGLGWSFCDNTECSEERTSGWNPETVQLLIEQRLNQDIYIQARAEANWWMYGSYGLHLKYVFPSDYVQKEHTGFYVRGGIQRYEVDLDKVNFGFREKEQYDGTSYSVGIGWQHYTSKRWGATAELFYTDLGRYNSYGTILTLSYRFGRSDY